jgi:ABC-type lipoprotein export system ATPase subunit
MKLKKAIEILEQYNDWRRGNTVLLMTHPKKLGKAIDKIIKKYKK